MMFTLDDLNILEIMPDFQIHAFGQPLPFKWVAPSAEFITADDGSEVRPDVTQWSTNDLVVSNEAYEKLSSIITSKLVEIYPLGGDGSSYSFVNPVARVGNEVIDTNKFKISYFEDGSVNEIESLVLKSSEVESLPALFTLTIDDGVDLYCTDVFVSAIEKENLKGLVFEEVELS